MSETLIYSKNPLSGFSADPSFGYIYAYRNPEFSLVSGKQYKVFWDDTENPYSVTAYDATLPDIGDFVAIGNGSRLGYQGNNEPFAIAVNSEYVFFFAFEDSASSHIVQIFADAENGETTDGTVLLEKQVVDGFAEAFDGVYTAQIESENFVVGKRYKIEWDDVVYYCTCKSALVPCVGNESYILGGNDPGEPFAVASGNNIITIYTRSTAASHTVAISQVEPAIGTVLEKQVIDGFTEAFDGVYTVQIESEGFTIGNRYKIEWDDVVYYCTCKSALAPCVGNESYILGGNDPGEPFAVASGNNIITIYTRSTASSHTVAISQVEPAIVLKDRNNNDVLYEEASAIKFPTADGGTRMFLEGEAEATTVSLDFSDGDMEIVPDGKKLFNRVSIPTPVGLVPTNIPEGVEIAGIVGSFIAKSNVKIAAGTSKGTDATKRTIQHGLGVMPDLVYLSCHSYIRSTNNVILNGIGLSQKFKEASGAQKAVVVTMAKWSDPNSSNATIGMGAYEDRYLESAPYFSNVNENSFTVGTSSIICSPNSDYYWFAIAGLTE